MHYGGPGMNAYRLYSKAKPGTFEITLVHGNPDHSRYDLFERQVMVRALRGSSWDQVQFIRAARRWVAEHARECDVFHGLQGFDLTVLPAFEAQRRGLPSVVKLAAHQSDLADKPGWRRWLGRPRQRRSLIRDLSAVIAISTAIRDELRSYGIPDSKIALIPNGVDTDQFHPAAAPSDKPRLRGELGWADRPTVLFVGGINTRKRPHLLVEALGLLHQRGVEAQVVLAGPLERQAYADEIRRRTQDLRIDDMVIWQGFTSDPAPLYRAADIFALPSANEGMPNALLEAMASGLPSVVTPISGSLDLVTEGVSGCVISPAAAPIADALATYLERPAAAIAHGQAGRDRISREYGHHAVLAQHLALFRQIIHG